MATDVQGVKVHRVEPSFNPVQDEDLDQYGDELAQCTIVDVDVHVDDTLMFMLDYMEGHFRKRMETVLQADFKGEPGNSLRNMIAHIAWLGSSYDKPPRAKLATKQDLLARMAKGIIDYSILFPSELLPIGYLPEAKWAAALTTAYNQYMVDAYQNLDGVKIAIVVAPQHPLHAAEEIDRHAAHPDVVSVCIPDVGVNPPIGDQKYWPIFEAAAGHGLPICFHGIEALIHDNYPLRVAHFHTLMQVNSMGFPFTSMLQIMSVVCAGIPVRYPNLKFAILEAGLTWMPFIMYRLDAAYLRYRTELPALERKAQRIHPRLVYRHTRTGGAAAARRPGQADRTLPGAGHDHVGLRLAAPGTRSDRGIHALRDGRYAAPQDPGGERAPVLRIETEKMTPSQPPDRSRRAKRKINVGAVDDFRPGTRMEVQVGGVVNRGFQRGRRVLRFVRSLPAPVGAAEPGSAAGNRDLQRRHGVGD